MSDVLLIYYASLGTVLCIGAGLLVGRILDLHWRTKQLRNLTKRDYGMLFIFNKDNRTLKATMVDFGKDEIKVGDEKWVVDNRHIYRFDKREKGLFATEAQMKWQEGVPMVFVDHDHLKPIEFYPPEGTTKPIEISAWLTAWVSNQLAKGTKGVEQYKILFIVTILLALVAAGLAYYNWQATQQLQGQIAALANQLPHFASNQTAVIVQPTPVP